MALEDKVREQAQTLLEPGETVEAAFPAGAALTLWRGIGIAALIVLMFGFLKPLIAGGLMGLIYFGVFNGRAVVVTDRAIVLMKKGKLTSTKPTAVVARLSRMPIPVTSFGPYRKIELQGRHRLVNRRFLKDVDAANAAIAGGPPAAER